MENRIEAFCRGEKAATAMEYGLIAALVSVAILVTLITLGDTWFGGHGVSGHGSQ